MISLLCPTVQTKFLPKREACQANIYIHSCLLLSPSSPARSIQEAELSVAAYLSTEKMEAYAENTYSSLLYLTLEAAGGETELWWVKNHQNDML